MKTILRSLFCFTIIFMLCLVNIAKAQTTYTWIGTSGASWAVGANWNPARTTPLATDIIQFNGKSIVTVTYIPTQTIRQLLITDSTKVVLQSAVTSILSINGPASTNNLIISGGSILTLGSTNTFSMNFVTTTTQRGDISGTLQLNSGNTFSTSAITAAPGVTASLTGIINNNGGIVTGSVSSLNFASGANYNHNMNGGAIPLATWNVSSQCNIMGITSTNLTAFSGTFGNLNWNTTGQTATGILTATTTITGNLNVLSGNMTLGAYAFTVSGNLNISGSFAITSSSGAKALGTVLISNGGSINLTAAATINMNGLNISEGGTWNSSLGNAIITINGNLNNEGVFTNATAATYSIAGNVVNNGTSFVSGNGAYTFTGLSKTISGLPILLNGAASVSGSYTNLATSLNIAGLLTVAGSLTNNSAITLSGTTAIAGAGTIINAENAALNLTSSSIVPTLNATANYNTVNYNSTTQAQTLKGTTYYNLIISKTGFTGTLGAATTIKNNLAIAGGTLADGTYLLTGVGLSSGTFDMSSAATSAITLTNATANPFPVFQNYIFHANASTVNFNANAAQNIPAISSFGNLILATGGVKTALGVLNVAGNLAINGGTLADGGNQINVGGNFNNNGIHSGLGNITLTGGSASHAISGSASTFGHLILNDSAVGATMTGAGTINIVKLTVVAGMLTLNSFTTGLNVNGATNIGAKGGIDFATATGTRVFTGDVTNYGTWNNTINMGVTFGGNIIDDGLEFDFGTGIQTFNGTGKTFSGTVANINVPNVIISGTLINLVPVFNCSTSLAGSGTFTMGINTDLYIGGTSAMTNLNCVTNIPNTVVYNGITQTVKGTAYNNLQIGTQNPSANPACSGGGLLTINGDFIIKNGSFADNAFAVTGNNLGKFIIDSNASYNTTRSASPWMPSLFTLANIELHPASTFNYKSITAHSIVANPNGTAIVTDYGTLGISGAVTKTLATDISAQNVIVSGSGILADGGHQLSGPGTGSGTLTIGSACALTLTNPNAAASNTSAVIVIVPEEITGDSNSN